MYVHARASVCMCVHVRGCACVRARACACVRAHVSVCACVCVCVCLGTCVCVFLIRALISYLYITRSIFINSFYLYVAMHIWICIYGDHAIACFLKTS